MSAPIVVPFNYQPVSTTVQVASYTIPAGKYARVLAECDSGGTITIGGVTAVSTSPFVNVNVLNNTNATYNVPTGYKFTVGSMGASGGAPSGYLNGNTNTVYNQGGAGLATVGMAVLGAAGATVGPGGSASAITASAATNACRLAGLAEPSNATHRQAEFWLPAGAVLNGTGSWRAIVSEYNAIS
jgi:hypothetical protein